MKIALMNEFSQASKNIVIFNELVAASTHQNHTIFNMGMCDDNGHRLTHVHLGITSTILLNSRSVDLVITGCSTGQGALMALNTSPGATCGYYIEPTDAYLFTQINNGNTLSLPFAKGLDWGAESNIRYISEEIFDGERGLGYPVERRESQNANAIILSNMKEATSKPPIGALQAIDLELPKQALGGKKFQKCFFDNSENKELISYVKNLLDRWIIMRSHI